MRNAVASWFSSLMAAIPTGAGIFIPYSSAQFGSVGTKLENQLATYQKKAIKGPTNVKP